MFKNSSKTQISRIFKNKSQTEPPKICFTEQVLARFKAYVDNCDLEIGWLALVRKDSLGRYIVYDTILPHQNVSAVTTDLMESGLQEVGEELLATRPDEFNNVRCWCHSHVNMQVCPSGTDDKTFEQFYENCDYFIRVICNKKSDMRVDFIDIENEIKFENTEWYILLSDETNEINKEIEKLEKQKNDIIKATEERIAELEKNIDDFRNEIYKEVEPEIKLKIKEKVKRESVYKYPSNNSKIYGSAYGYYDYDDDLYPYGYYGSQKKTDIKEMEEEEFEIEWKRMSQEEKESVCDLAMVQLLDKEDGMYCDALDIVDKKKFVKMLDAYTLNELKDILRDEPITKEYTEDDWMDLYDELGQFGIEIIESTLRGEMDYGL